MFGIFKDLFHRSALSRSAKGTSDVSFSKAEKAVLRGLDVDKVMTDHHAWKNKISAYVSGNSLEYLRPDIVGMNHRCDLGRWIMASQHTVLGTSPLFERLKLEHQNFHFHASYIVSYTHAGKLAEAEKLLNEGFENSSKRLIALLDQMR